MKPEIELILDSTHDAMIAIDINQRITLFNRAAERLTGKNAAESIGRDVTEVVDNTRLPYVMQHDVQELNRRQILGETEIITNRMPVKDEQGNVVGAIAVFRDVGELSRLSAEVTDLSHTLETWQSLFDAIQDAISVVDAKGNLLLINEHYKKLSGVTSADGLIDALGEAGLHKRVLSSGQAVKAVQKYIGILDKHVIIDCAPLKVGHEIIGSAAVIHDFSEITRLSSDLDQAKSIIRNLEAKYTFEDILGNHPRMLEAIEKAKLAATTNATLLLRGESGTGKELFAHAIHNASERKFHQFIRVNCAAINPNLLESELFGYVEGSFTGAKKGGHVGYFQQAHRGTIFLDEIAEIDLNTQAKLLRVLQEKEIQPVGSPKTIEIDLRIISATNADLEQLIKAGKFREDLYYRLNVFPIQLPALAERPEDIEILALELMKKLNREYGKVAESISSDALFEMMRYRWPGNVRELENIIARAMINMKLGERVIEAGHLPPLVSSPAQVIEDRPPDQTAPLSLKDYLARQEKRYIEQLLARNGDNKTQTAKDLAISIRSLYYKISAGK